MFRMIIAALFALVLTADFVIAVNQKDGCASDMIIRCLMLFAFIYLAAGAQS